MEVATSTLPFQNNSYISYYYLQIVRGTSLKILGLVTSDAGVYQCIVTSQDISIQASAQLQVKSKGIKMKPKLEKF